MLLKENNLVIRNTSSEDAQILCKWWNDGKVMAHAGFPKGLGISKQEIIKDLANDDDRIQRLVIEINEKPVGEMNYRDKGNNIAEMGIKICDFNMQEKGFGTKLIKMLINYLFNSIGYTKIILDTNLKNKIAQHVYKKIGFKQVSVKIDSWKNQLGELQSSIDYELFKKDFKL